MDGESRCRKRDILLNEKLRQTLYRWPHRNVEDHMHGQLHSYLETAETPPLQLV